MPLTDPELQGIAAQSLNMALKSMDDGDFNFLIASYHIGDTPPLHRMKKIEKTIIERLGENWLNSGRAKDTGFQVIRMCVEILPPDAIAFVTICNRFKTTPKFDALTPEQQQDLANATHDRHHQAVKSGLLTLNDALTAVVQTPDRVCQYIQDFELGKTAGRPDVLFTPQEDFDGRLKMFGSSESNYGKARTTKT